MAKNSSFNFSISIFSLNFFSSSSIFFSSSAMCFFSVMFLHKFNTPVPPANFTGVDSISNSILCPFLLKNTSSTKGLKSVSLRALSNLSKPITPLFKLTKFSTGFPIISEELSKSKSSVTLLFAYINLSFL